MPWKRSLQKYLRSLRIKSVGDSRSSRPENWEYRGGTVIRPRDHKRENGTEKKFMTVQCRLFSFLCKFNLVPYRWDDEEKEFRKHESPWYFRIWFVTVAMWSWGIFGFTLFRFIQASSYHWRSTKRMDLSAVVVLWTAMAFRSIVCVASYELSRYSDILVGFGNQILRIRKSGRSELKQDFYAAKVMTFIFALRTTQLIFTGCTKPNRAQFLYSILPTEWRNTWTYTLYVLFTIYTSLATWLLVFQVFLCISFVDTAECMLKKILPRAQLPPKGKAMSYKKLQLLLCLFHNCTVIAVPYVKYYTLIVSTTCTFGCIRFYEKIDLRIYLTMPLSILSLLAFGYQWYGRAGKIPHFSQRAVRKMFANRDDVDPVIVRENRTYMRACRKMMVFKIKRTVFPAMIRFISVQTIRLLLVTSGRSRR